MEGWVKLYRKLSEKAFYSKDSEKVHLWIHLLIKANHLGYEEMLGGKPIVCQPGQFTTGRKQLSLETGISESKIERILFYFEKTEQQIEQQKTNTNRLITILNWEEYQQNEQQIEQRPNNDRTTTEQRPNNDRTHSKNDKNVKNGKNVKNSKIFVPPSIEEVESYFKENGFDIVLAKRFFDSYSVANWNDSKGNQVKNWKQKAINVWFKEENKPKQQYQNDSQQLKPQYLKNSWATK